MENFEEINKLTGGLRHVRIRDADELKKYAVPVDTVPRPGFNTTGKEIEVQMNAFPIVKFPNKTIYQYDVGISSIRSLKMLWLNYALGPRWQRSWKERRDQESLGFKRQKICPEADYLRWFKIGLVGSNQMSFLYEQQ